MKNILHINSNYLTSWLHENVMDYLSQGNVTNHIYMPMKKEKQEDILYDSKHQVHSPIVFNDVDKYIFTWKQRKIYNTLKQTIPLSDIQFVHAHTLFTDGNVALKLYEEYGIPYAVTVRSFTDIEGFFHKRINLRARGRKILKQASKIIFLSDHSKENLIDTYIKDTQLKESIRQKAVLVPNGIDDFWFENEGQPKKLDATKPLRIITVGQIRKRKNQDVTLLAASLIEKTIKRPVELTMVGKVIEKSYLEKLEATGIPFKLIEYIPKEKLIEEYREHDLFILPSRYETFGLVYPEAMSQGLPVLYSKGQGFYKQFEEGSVGYAVDSNDPEDVADKAVKILSHYDAISEQALSAYKKFNWKEQSEKLLTIYENESL